MNCLSRLVSFNSRPHKEVDSFRIDSFGRLQPFNSRPHKEVDSLDLRIVGLSTVFQFTTSQGGRLEIALKRLKLINLSIHDLTRRSTLPINIYYLRSRSFNSRPHKEVDGGDTSDPQQLLFFQFTTSQGGRPVTGICYLTMQSFNSRPHKEVDHAQAHRQRANKQTFNSRPHKEVDFDGVALPDGMDLSIHDLTRRSTILSRISVIPRSLSIHDLTRRSTYNRLAVNRFLNLSIHDLTRRSTRLALYAHHPHGLSIHDLTRRSTCGACCESPANCLSIHDLTRRSTLDGNRSRACTASFNSRPHKEVDF